MTAPSAAGLALGRQEQLAAIASPPTILRDPQKIDREPPPEGRRQQATDQATATVSEQDRERLMVLIAGLRAVVFVQGFANRPHVVESRIADDRELDGALGREAADPARRGDPRDRRHAPHAAGAPTESSRQSPREPVHA